MNKKIISLLQFLVVVLAISSFIFMILEPQHEGRNINSTFSQIYFNDPFLVWAYTASIAFYVGLFQTFKILSNSKKGNLFSHSSLKALKIIKYCGTIVVGFVLLAETYLIVIRPEEDIAGGVFMGLLLIAFFGFVTIVATRSEKLLTKILR